MIAPVGIPAPLGDPVRDRGRGRGARKNVLIILMSVELMLNGVNVAFVAAGSYLGDAAGGVFAFMVMTVAAAEAAVGLALLIALYRLKETVDITELKVLKW